MARIDKWLWGARFYKTRALANKAVNSGKIRLNDSRTKPSRSLNLGDEISINRGQGNDITITVLDLDEKRVAYPIAMLRYQETPESLERKANRQALAESGLISTPHPQTKPDKKQRRQLIALRKQ